MATIDNTTSLTSFKALSFDCYGTLINWEPALAKALEPLISQLPASHPYQQNSIAAVQRFTVFSDHLEHSQPNLIYNENLAQSFRQLAEELKVPFKEEDAIATGAAPGTFPAFADSVEGLKILKKHYKLIILSNIDNKSITRTVSERLGGLFDAVYTAENIGSYKPSHGNFEYLFKQAKTELGMDKEKGDLLHVARSLTADHVPAKELRLRSVWICRGGDRKEGYGIGGDYENMLEKKKVGFEWKFDSIGDFAKEVERQFQGEVERK